MDQQVARPHIAAHLSGDSAPPLHAALHPPLSPQRACSSMTSRPDLSTSSIQQKLAALRGVRRASLSTKKPPRQQLAPVVSTSTSALLLATEHQNQLGLDDLVGKKRHQLRSLAEVTMGTDRLAPRSSLKFTGALPAAALSSNSRLLHWHASNNTTHNNERKSPAVSAVDPVLLRLDAVLEFDHGQVHERHTASRNEQGRRASELVPAISDARVNEEELRRSQDDDDASRWDINSKSEGSRPPGSHIRTLQNLKHHRQHVGIAHNPRQERVCVVQLPVSGPQRADATDPVDSVSGTTLARYRRLVGMVARTTLTLVKAVAAERVVRHRQRSRCASRIQRAVRAFLRSVQEQERQRAAARTAQCALLIQYAVCAFRRRFHGHRKESAAGSATVIQCAWRGAQARREAASLRQHVQTVYHTTVREPEVLVLKKNRAAACIQRRFLAARTRQKTLELALVRRERAVKHLWARWRCARRARQPQLSPAQVTNGYESMVRTLRQQSKRPSSSGDHHHLSSSSSATRDTRDVNWSDDILPSDNANDNGNDNSNNSSEGSCSPTMTELATSVHTVAPEALERTRRSGVPEDVLLPTEVRLPALLALEVTVPVATTTRSEAGVAPETTAFARVVRAWLARTHTRRHWEERAKRSHAATQIQRQVRRWLATRCVRRVREAALRELREELAEWWSRSGVRVARTVDGGDASDREHSGDGDEETDDSDVESQNQPSFHFAGLNVLEVLFLPTRNGQVPPGVPLEQLCSGRTGGLWKWNWSSEVWTIPS